MGGGGQNERTPGGHNVMFVGMYNVAYNAMAQYFVSK
jgi:hypothetical protein